MISEKYKPSDKSDAFSFSSHSARRGRMASGVELAEVDLGVDEEPASASAADEGRHACPSVPRSRTLAARTPTESSESTSCGCFSAEPFADKDSDKRIQRPH